MPMAIDLTNQRFGKLVAIKKGPKLGKDSSWECICDCGKTVNIRTYSLTSGNTSSCGHCKEPSSQIGMRFGKLVVIEPVEGTYKKYYNKGMKWRCQCDCGNVCEVKHSNLTRGITTSCGCIHTKFIYDRLLNDISGQRFGKLVAVKFVGSNKYKQAQWLCQCDCGNTTIVSGFLLRQGNVQSCGCLKSHGEQKIKKILQSQKIDFVAQKIFNDCIFEDTKKRARFDFYVQNKYCIEYDGILHFETKNSGWNNTKTFERTKHRDEIKNEYCKKNGIPLIRIPYTHLEKICLEDLLLETSKYRVV